MRLLRRLRGDCTRSYRTLRDAPADISQYHLAIAWCEMSRRDGAIVAWHEVPGTTPPRKSRPVGYGIIRAGVRTDSTHDTILSVE